MSAELPLFSEPVHGVRKWRIGRNHSLLGSGRGRMGPRWRPGAHTDALCLRAGGHPTPAADCSCGLYGFHPFIEPDQGEWRADVAFGVVAAEGRIELHWAGFRAERARPVALFAPPAFRVPDAVRDQLFATAECYGVPAIELPDPWHAAEWCAREGLGLGPEVVQDLLADSIPRARRLSPEDLAKLQPARTWFRPAKRRARPGPGAPR